MYVYQNGVIKKKEDAALSIDDRGYTFGEGIYEVVRVYGGGYLPWRIIGRDLSVVPMKWRYCCPIILLGNIVWKQSAN